MITKRLCIACLTAFLAVSLAVAQEVLPKPEEGFKDAKIGRTYKDSKPGTMTLTKAPAGAPNILIVLIDDSGFGQWGTFGGQVPTPNLDRLARMGLRYTRFHTTALCSPTRAALLTGRNHHSAGTGVITEIRDAYPGYSGQIPKSTAMFAEVLRESGYSTAFIGKNHNIADRETSISGPYDRWPNLQGSDYSTVSLAERWTNGNRSSIATRRQ
jgi:arylsulfatase A-like enzyme